MNEPLLFLILGLLAFVWLSAMRAREAALRVARRECRRHDLELLDETVVLSRMRPARDRSGRLVLRRTYLFDFTIGPVVRRSGWVEFVGPRATALELDLDDHRLFTDFDNPMETRS